MRLFLTVFLGIGVAIGQVSIGPMPVLHRFPTPITAASGPAALGPAAVTIGGCPVAPVDSIFTYPITALPVSANSALQLSRLQGYGIGAEPGFPHNIVRGTSYPTWNMKYYYGGATQNVPLLSWPNKKRENGWNASSSDQEDHHMLTVAVGKCQFYEEYNAVVDPSITFGCQDGSSGCNASAGDIFSSTDEGIYGGTDAAGLPQWLVLRLAEIKSAQINHPTRFTLARGFIQMASAGNCEIWPANAYDSCNGWGGADSLPYGARLRLHSSFDVSTYSQYAQNILNSFKTQGIINADVGTTGAIQVDQDVWTDPAVASAVYEAVGALHFSDFDVVDESGLMVSPMSAQVNVALTPASPIGVGLLNSQVSALVTGTSYTYNFGADAWVTNSTNQALTWSVVSGPGSVNSLTGVYTVPATISGVTEVRLQAISAANPRISATQYILLYPVSGDGNFRTALGGQFQDDNGYTWFRTAGLETGILTQFPWDYPNWASGPEWMVWQSTGYTYGDDLHWRFIVPNGTYNVRFMFDGGGQGGCQPLSNPVCSLMGYSGPSDLGINSVMLQSDWDWGVNVNWQRQQAYDYVAPASVNNNVLDVWIGTYNPDGSQNRNSPSLSGLELMPLSNQ